MWEESLHLSKVAGNRLTMAIPLHNLAELARLRGDFERARYLQEKSLALRREFGDKTGIARSLCDLGLVMQALGNFEEAARLGAEGLAICHELGNKQSIMLALEAFASLFLAASNEDLDDDPVLLRASVLLAGTVDRLRQLIASPIRPADRGRYETEQSLRLSRLGSSGYEECRREGQTLSIDDAVALAFERSAGLRLDESATLRSDDSVL